MSGAARRRWLVQFELLLAAAICVAGFRYGAGWMQVHEASWVVAALRLCGFGSVSGVLPGHILVFRSGHDVLDAVVTPSCSAILSLLGLTALTVVVLRSRRWHAVWGLAMACAAVLVTNDLRLAASTLAGLAWGGPALVLFHDWVGTLWNFAATLGGFLLLVALSLPEARRAEQDVGGRHTARRPTSWARPGLGYRAPEPAAAGRPGGRSLTGLFYRYVLPDAVTRSLSARREAARIDYRLGHLTPGLRAVQVRSLAADGLGAHTATLLAVATYDADSTVLDTLADAVAARQEEPVTSHRVAALRLWARGWMFGRSTAGRARPAPPLPSAGEPGVVRSREAARIDHRLGHLSPGLRAVQVRSLVADGLGVHTATLLAVATYDADSTVLDTLADAVAARQWEPVTSHRVAALRLWARGWTLSRSTAARPRPAPPYPYALALAPSPSTPEDYR